MDVLDNPRDHTISDAYQVRDQTSASHLLNSVLGRFRLFLSVDDWDVRHGNAEEVLPAKPVSQLYKCLNERGRLDVTSKVSEEILKRHGDKMTYPTVPPYKHRMLE